MVGGLLVDLVDFGQDGAANPFEFHSTILKPDLERNALSNGPRCVDSATYFHLPFGETERHGDLVATKAREIVVLEKLAFQLADLILGESRALLARLAVRRNGLSGTDAIDHRRGLVRRRGYAANGVVRSLIFIRGSLLTAGRRCLRAQTNARREFVVRLSFADRLLVVRGRHQLRRVRAQRRVLRE